MRRDFFARSHRKNIKQRQRLVAQQLESRLLLAADDWLPESILNSPLQGYQATGPQHQSATVFDDRGGMVAYSGKGNGDSKGIFIRSVDTEGTPVGDALRINSQSAGIQRFASIATLSDGSAIVSWAGKGEGDDFGIFARRLSAEGSFLTEEFRINETTWKFQTYPVIAPLADGGFAIAWTGYGSGDHAGVFARQFDAGNNSVRPETWVNPSSLGFQNSPQIVGLAGGGYAVAWSGWGSDDCQGVYVRRYPSDGSATLEVTRVNPDTFGYQGSPDLAVLPDGELLVTWTGRGADDGWGVYARQLDIDNQPATDAVLVNRNTAGLQYAPTVATSDDGSFLILWTEFGPSGFDRSVKGRHFENFDSPEADEFELPVTTSGSQYAASLASDGSGGYLATWMRQKNWDDDVYVRQLPGMPSSDPDPPIVSLQLANDTGNSSDAITSDMSLAATVVDASAIDSVTFSVSIAGDPSTSADVSLFHANGLLNLSDADLRSLLLNLIFDGEIMLQLSASDSIGNIAVPIELTVLLDTTAPGSPQLQLSAATDADGHTDRFEYDELGNVTSIRDALNGGNRVDGQISVPGQQQLYSFTISDETILLLDPMTPDPVFTWSLDGPQGNLVDQQRFDIQIFDSSRPGLRVIPGAYLLTVDALEGVTGDFTFRLFDVSAAPTLPLGVQTVITFDPDNQTAIYQLDAKAGQDYFIEFEDINDTPEFGILNSQGGFATGSPSRGLNSMQRYQNSVDGAIAIYFECPFQDDLPEGAYESSRAVALERGDYRLTLTPTTTTIGDFEFTLVGLASNPINANTNINVPLGGNTQAVRLMIPTETDQSWTVGADAITGIDPDDAIIRIIDSTGRDVTRSQYWSAEYVTHDSTYDGELDLLVGSRQEIPNGCSITFSASPFSPRLLPINLNETINETLTGAAWLNSHTFTL